jgi:hypothetical protein
MAITDGVKITKMVAGARSDFVNNKYKLHDSGVETKTRGKDAVCNVKDKGGAQKTGCFSRLRFLKGQPHLIVCDGPKFVTQKPVNSPKDAVRFALNTPCTAKGGWAADDESVFLGGFKKQKRCRRSRR